MMRDYDELVERLHKRIALTYTGSPCQEDLLEAADAIEELVKVLKEEGGRKIVWEDLFEVYKRMGDNSYRLASNMDIYNAVLFMQAWMQENYADQLSSLELRRQPITGEGAEE